MLRYVEKLTRTPGAVREEDVSALRAAGFTDEDILAIAEVAAYYAYANRIADGLGVALEAGTEDPALPDTPPELGMDAPENRVRP